MGKSRLGRKERLALRQQYGLVKEAKSALIAENLSNLKAMPTSRGYRSVNVMEGYTFHGASNMQHPDMRGADRGFAKSKY